MIPRKRRAVRDVKDVSEVQTSASEPERIVGEVDNQNQNHPELRDLEASLGYVFSDLELLQRAITHRSFTRNSSANVNALPKIRIKEGAALGDYERLEFVGDAVLDLAIGHLLSEKHKRASEGDLSKMRAALVSTVSLAEVGRGMRIGSLVRLSKGEAESGGAERDALLADVVEAIFGAIYYDKGYPAALDVIRRIWGEKIVNVSPRDPKTELQERLHVLKKGAPVYVLELCDGPQHAPRFVSAVKIDGEIVGRGAGTSKKISQQKAAADALAKLIS